MAVQASSGYSGARTPDSAELGELDPVVFGGDVEHVAHEREPAGAGRQRGGLPPQTVPLIRHESKGQREGPPPVGDRGKVLWNNMSHGRGRWQLLDIALHMCQASHTALTRWREVVLSRASSGAIKTDPNNKHKIITSAKTA